MVVGLRQLRGCGVVKLRQEPVRNENILGDPRASHMVLQEIVREEPLALMNLVQ